MPSTHLFLLLAACFLFITFIDAQTFITGDNSSVADCTHGCSHKDESRFCLDGNAHFYERILMGQLRYYISTQVGISLWHKNHKGVARTKNEWVLMAVGGHTATWNRLGSSFAVSGRHVSSFRLSRPFSNGLELIRDVLPLFFLQVKVPEWSDLVKLGVTKDMAPLRQFFRKRHPQGSQVEALKWVDKSENGKGRILSKQTREDVREGLGMQWRGETDVVTEEIIDQMADMITDRVEEINHRNRTHAPPTHCPIPCEYKNTVNTISLGLSIALNAILIATLIVVLTKGCGKASRRSRQLVPTEEQ
ncbi:hypothetical protein PRIPAC_97262 [Pristionchus pacificus]|uniref:Uncharacterized protein n=1 Tax=Pristionchus pacificus TaxID=54126 RepID=A0A2A6D1M3_PRIPA|nr:hypothetical protein PRIPAC_97262 [Pristionchus pacificus]|eukprot:PDM84197.1 hypothetical protein PRIPAC_33220 [Pristionchus pacificus]